MTPQAKLKARFQEVADDAKVRFAVRRRNNDYYVTIFAEFEVRERHLRPVLPGAYMTSSGPFDATYRLGPDTAIERLLAEMEVDPDWLAWHDGTVVKIATEIRRSRTFEKLPVLGDALEEAGCTNEAILKHCRAHGPHFHTCWAVDLILGEAKEK
ncbi:MAG: hypothetical protein AB7K24_07675 [Gemmataceae bacterium]